MSPGPHQLARDAVPLIDPAPAILVFPLDRARPGTREADLPRFGEPHWQLAALDHAESGKTMSINWEEFPSSLQAGFMRAGWAVINVPTPGVLLHRSGSSTRPRLSPGSLQRTFRAWRFFAGWLSGCQVCRLDQTGQHLLEEYPQALRDRGLARAAVTLEMFTITRLWAYAPFLLPEDRIPMPPWDQAGAGMEDFLGETAQSPGENTTIPIHPAVMSPLLIWALRTITDFAPDIIAAWRETRRLLDRVPSKARQAGREDILTYLRHLRETRQPLPVYASARARTLARAHQAMARQQGKTAGDRPLIHNAFIAGVLSVSVTQVASLLRDRPEELDGLQFGTGAPLPVPVTARLDSLPWTSAIDIEDAMDLALHLSAAALITVGYLSGMRPEEKGAELH